MSTYNIINCKNITMSYHIIYFYVIIEYFEMYFIIKQYNCLSKLNIQTLFIIDSELINGRLSILTNLNGSHH